METTFDLQCPFCGETIVLDFYPEDGKHQEMITDCEVCCQPIQFDVRFDRDGEASITAERAQ